MRPHFCPKFALRNVSGRVTLAHGYPLANTVCTYSIASMMMDIDSSGFEHGMPTRQEMLEHQCHLLSGEIDALKRDLALAQHNLKKLIEINQGLNNQVVAESLRANGAHVRLVQVGNRLRCNHGIDITNWFPD